MSQSTNVAKKEESPVAAFSGFLEKFKPQLALALPKHLTADRMARLALTAFSSSGKLQNCDPKSIASSIMTAGQLGLEPGVNGAGFLVPYKTTCTFVPGWKGLVDLVSRSGRGTVYTGVIFSDQSYTYTDGAKRDLVIHNETDLEDPEDITHAYAIGWVKDATMPIIELWRVSKIMKHRDKYNKVGSNHYSYRDWEMYCRKVPLLQVLKYMPCSVEVNNAIAISNAAEAGRGATIEGGIVIDMDSGDFRGDDTPKSTTVPAYPADAFEKNLPSWRKLIAEGKKSIDQILAMVQTKGQLSDEQKAALSAPDSAAGSAVQTEASEGVSFASVADKLHKASEPELLDIAADLIGEVADPAQRSELTAIYRQRKAQMEA